MTTTTSCSFCDVECNGGVVRTGCFWLALVVGVLLITLTVLLVVWCTIERRIVHFATTRLLYTEAKDGDRTLGGEVGRERRLLYGELW